MGDDHHHVQTQKMCQELKGISITDATFDTKPGTHLVQEPFLNSKEKEKEKEKDEYEYEEEEDEDDTDMDLGDDMQRKMMMEMEMYMKNELQAFEKKMQEKVDDNPKVSQETLKMLELCAQAATVPAGEPVTSYVPCDCKLNKLLMKKGSTLTKGDPMYVITVKPSEQELERYGPPPPLKDEANPSDPYHDFFRFKHSSNPWDPSLLTAPSSFMVTDIMVEEGQELKKFQPFFKILMEKTSEYFDYSNYELEDFDMDMEGSLDEYIRN